MATSSWLLLPSSSLPAQLLSLEGRRPCCTLWRSTTSKRSRGRMRKLVLSGLLRQAVKGTVEEVLATEGPLQRLRVAVAIVVTLWREVVGLMAALPVATYALHLHRSLPGLKLAHASGNRFVESEGGTRQAGKAVEDVELSRRASWPRLKPYKAHVVRDLRFGVAERNLLDLYVPSGHSATDSLPVVIFVHGGIWAMGEKWQFSALGAYLADNGVLAVLVQYSLFPQVLACDQVKEVSCALSWTLDHIQEYGGDLSKVFLMGHSSGAHVSAMVVWERAQVLADSSGDGMSGHLDTRQPYCFIGLAGVYDIAEHYKYESRRGVAALSCMKPAIGGPARFSAMSPTLLCRSLLLSGQSHSSKKLLPPCYLYSSHADTVVPPDTSIAFWDVLRDLGCNARLILHDTLSHDDFAFWDKGWLKDTRCAPLVKDLLALFHDQTIIHNAISVAGANELHEKKVS